MRIKAKRCHGRLGAAVVEFAIMGGVMVFLMIGTLELSRGLMVRETLNNAARTACRQGSLPGASNSALQATISSVLTDNNLSSKSATITIRVNGSAADVSTASQGDKLSVQISLPSSSFSWVQSIFLAGRTVESTPYVMMKQG